MGKGWPKWLAGVLISAFANCLAGHVVDCLFQRVGLRCPRDNTA
jgi:hypothetical protein